MSSRVTLRSSRMNPLVNLTQFEVMESKRYSIACRFLDVFGGWVEIIRFQMRPPRNRPLLRSSWGTGVQPFCTQVAPEGASIRMAPEPVRLKKPWAIQGP